LKGLIARITIIAPLILGVVVAMVLDILDDLKSILVAVKDGEITVQEQRTIDYRRSRRRWTTITSFSSLAPFFTVEQ